MGGRIKRAKPQKTYCLPIIGKIKVGIKDERGIPQSIDYFIPTGKYADLFRSAYGNRPSSIQIVFISDDPEHACNEEYQYRDDYGNLIASGDGETFKVWNGKEYAIFSVNEYPDIMNRIAAKSPNKRVRKGLDGWDVILTLTFIIPLVRGVAGLWQYITKGDKSSIPSIRDTFDAMLSERGFCKGIIWDMNVKFATSQKPGNKSRYPVVSIVPNESESNLRKVKEAYKPVKLVE